MVVCFAVIVQFNSNICMKILQHMSQEFDNRFYFIGYHNDKTQRWNMTENKK